MTNGIHLPRAFDYFEESSFILETHINYLFLARIGLHDQNIVLIRP